MFSAVLDVLADVGAVPVDVIRRLRLDDTDEEGTPSAVYLGGIAETASASADIEQLLDDAAARDGILVESQFALEMVRGSLPACMIYVSYREILIRPADRADPIP